MSCVEPVLGFFFLFEIRPRLLPGRFIAEQLFFFLRFRRNPAAQILPMHFTDHCVTVLRVQLRTFSLQEVVDLKAFVDYSFPSNGYFFKVE